MAFTKNKIKTSLSLAKSISKYYFARLQSSRLGYESYIPGNPLRIFMWGTAGIWNTGADVRTHEIVRQTCRVLGANNIDIRLAVFDKTSRINLPKQYSGWHILDENMPVPEHYFKQAHYIRPRDFSMRSFLTNIDQSHMFMSIDGGLFLSREAIFSVPIALGMNRANRQNKISLGYGAEGANNSPWPLHYFYSKLLHNPNTLIITRTEYNSVLERLGLNIKTGTDTAWTFSPLSPSFGKEVLTKSGWDQKARILAICPNKILAAQKGMKSNNGSGVYNKKIISSFVNAITAFSQNNKIFPIIISMSRTDMSFSELLAARLGGVPHFAYGNYDMFQLVSILRCADLLISSRYHAVVLSMPAGIPSGWIGSEADFRYKDIFGDRNHLELIANMKDYEFEEKLLALLIKLESESGQISDDIQKSVVRHLHKMSYMGKVFNEVVSDSYPEFPVPDNKKSWEDFLPPLDSSLINLLEKHS